MRQHSGVISAVFFLTWSHDSLGRDSYPDPDGIAKEPGWLRFYTNLDARLAYVKLRERYPEHEDLFLSVRVLHVNEMISNWRDPAGDEHKIVAARQIDTSIWRTEPGLHPFEKLAWKGEPPRIDLVPRSSPLSMSISNGATDTTVVRKVMEVFAEDRLDWA